MTTAQRDLLLITGIPGTGKTYYGNKFATEFGFAHYDLEDPQFLGRFRTIDQLISELLSSEKNVVVTWGFNPEDPPSIELLQQLKNAGFKLIWFDGNRETALKRFELRAKSKSVSISEYYLRMSEFYTQMYRIETSNIIATLKPTIVNSFDSQSEFKPAAQVLEEIRNA